MRTIDADALKKEFSGSMQDAYPAPHIRATIDTAPTIGGWVSVKNRPPEMHESIFAKFYGSELWTQAMWREESDRMIVRIVFPDGTKSVDTGRLYDGEWRTDIVSRTLNPRITYWRPMPEPPKEDDGK